MRYVIVNFLFMFILIDLLNAQVARHDGYWWIGLEGSLSNMGIVNKSEIERLVIATKMSYITGLLDGIETSRQWFDPVLQNLPDTSMRRYLHSNNDKIYNMYSRVTIDQYEAGLSKLYEDYRNRQILVVTAMSVVAEEVIGESNEKIEWDLRFLRADEETRRKMLEEKERSQR